MSKYDSLLVASDDPVLKAICAPVEPGTFLDGIADEMANVCKKGSRKGVGLAAPQIGYPMRMVFINCADGSGTIRSEIMVNPVIVSRSAETNVAVEGCLSYPEVEKSIARPNEITVEYETLKRFPKCVTAGGFRARVICHEVDHLDGICRVGDDSPADGETVKPVQNVRRATALIAATAIMSLPSR